MCCTCASAVVLSDGPEPGYHEWRIRTRERFQARGNPQELVPEERLEPGMFPNRVPFRLDLEQPH